MIHFGEGEQRYAIAARGLPELQAWQPVDATSARAIVRSWAARAGVEQLRALLEQTSGTTTSRWARRADLEREILHQLGWRLSLVRQDLPPLNNLVAQREDPTEPPPPEEEQHFVELELVYPDGTPVEGLDYTVIDPAGTREDGTTGGDGKVRKDPVEGGGWMCELKSVDVVVWGHKRVPCFEPTTISIRTSGYPDGTKVKVHLYEEHHEGEDERLTTLEGEIEHDSATIDFQYDVDLDELAPDRGVHKLIAEAIVDGDAWSKTLAPLVVEMPMIASVQWSAGSARVGAPVRIAITTRGIVDGTSATVKVHAKRWLDDGDAHVDLGSVTIQGGRAETQWTFDPPEAVHESETPPPVYAVVEVESPIARTGHSPLLFPEAS